MRTERLGIGDDTTLARAAVLHIVLADAVEFGGVARCGSIASTFFGNHVDDGGTIVFGSYAQNLLESLGIVAVHGSVVAETEFLEEAQRSDEAVGGVYQFGNLLPGVFPGELFDDGLGAGSEPGVGIRLLQRGEVVRERAHVAVDTPLIIIEDEDELACGGSYVVEPLQSGAAGESAVAHYCYHMVVIAGKVTGGCHTQRGRERCAGVACTVGIVFGFAALAESAEPFELADGVELFRTSREELVHIALVRNVEKNLITRGGEYAVQGDAQLHQPKIWC